MNKFINRVANLSNGHQLNYMHLGAGQSLVLLTGSHTTINTWSMGFVHELAKSFSLYLVDYLAINVAGESHGRDSFAAMANDVMDFIQVLELDKPIVLGWSMGGGVATELAFNYAEQLSALILVAPVTPNNFVIDSFVGEDEFTTREDMFDFIFRVNINEYTRNQLKLWCDLLISHNALIVPRREVTDCQNQAIDDWRSSTPIESLCMINLPTLVIVPRCDQILDFTSTISDVQRLKRSKLIVVSECGHNVCLQLPKETSAAILEFYSQNKYGA